MTCHPADRRRGCLFGRRRARPWGSAAVTARPRAAGHAPRGASARSPAGLARARTVARSFAESYLAVAYGRASAGSVTGVTPAFRLELARAQPLVTPIERERHPRAVSVKAVGQAPGFVLATAWVSDGGISTYPLRFTVREGPGGWLVSDVVGGLGHPWRSLLEGARPRS